MSDFEKVSQPNLLGRKKYSTSFSCVEITAKNVADIVKTYYTDFLLEVPQIKMLHDYYKGNQPILVKKRDELANSNETIVINIARTASKNIKSAFIGEETQYLPVETDNEQQKAAIKDLVTLYRAVEEPAHNSRIEGDRGKYGYAYEFITNDKNGKTKLKRLLPFKTSMVFSEDDEDEPVFAYNFYDRLNEKGDQIGIRMQVYTANKVFSYDASDSGVPQSDIFEQDNPTGIMPIVMYENNDELMGDFEPAIPILNAINKVYSDRIDNIDDIVEAFLVFVNTEIYEQTTGENGEITYDNKKLIAMKKNRAIEIKGEQGLPADVKHVVNTLDQQNIQLVCDNLVRLAYTVMLVPDGVNSKSGGGSDSAEADNTREGFKQFEQLLNDKERFFKKGLKKRIELIKRLNALNGSNLGSIEVENVDIRFIRSKNLNGQSDAQIIQILQSTGLFSPDTIIAMSNLCESPQEEINKIIGNYDKLLKENRITKEQHDMLVVSFFAPNVDLNTLFKGGTENAVAVDGSAKGVGDVKVQENKVSSLRKGNDGKHS